MANASDTLPVDHLQPAHLPGGRSISLNQHRRGMLISLAGIAAAGAAAPAQAADPVLPLVAHAEALQRQADALAAVGDEAGADHLWHQRWLADDEVLATAPTTLDGLIQQLRILGERLEMGTRGQDDSDDVRKLMRYAARLAGLERLA